MVDSSVVDNLTREARELMQVGGFGLYEFVWSLNGMYPEMAYTEKLAVARAALVRLVAEDNVRIVLYDWPPDDEVGELTLSDIDDSRFKSLDELTPYAAVIPADVCAGK